MLLIQSSPWALQIHLFKPFVRFTFTAYVTWQSVDSVNCILVRRLPHKLGSKDLQTFGVGCAVFPFALHPPAMAVEGAFRLPVGDCASWASHWAVRLRGPALALLAVPGCPSRRPAISGDFQSVTWWTWVLTALCECLSGVWARLSPFDSPVLHAACVELSGSEAKVDNIMGVLKRTDSLGSWVQYGNKLTHSSKALLWGWDVSDASLRHPLHTFWPGRRSGSVPPLCLDFPLPALPEQVCYLWDTWMYSWKAQEKR